MPAPAPVAAPVVAAAPEETAAEPEAEEPEAEEPEEGEDEAQEAEEAPVETQAQAVEAPFIRPAPESSLGVAPPDDPDGEVVSDAPASQPTRVPALEEMEIATSQQAVAGGVEFFDEAQAG